MSPRRGVMLAAVGAAGVGACLWGGRAIASAESQAPTEWRAAPGTRVRLELLLTGGDAGWCVETATTTVTATTKSFSRGCQTAQTSSGAIYAETCSSGGEEGAVVSVLTRREVAAVSIEGGPQVPTVSDPTLPDGLRAAALQRLGYQPRAFYRHCPAVTAYSSGGETVSLQTGHPVPMSAERAATIWEDPGRPPRTPCRITATQLRPGTVAWSGMAVRHIRPVGGLLGSAFLSCADTVYIRSEGHYITAAILLDAEHPGGAVPPLPLMQPLAGHVGIFAAHSSEGTIVARRIPRAWLVATEETPEGLATPVALLEHLRATIDLPRSTR